MPSSPTPRRSTPRPKIKKIAIFGGIADFANTGRREHHYPRRPGRPTVVKKRQRWRVGISNWRPIFSRSHGSRHSGGLAEAGRASPDVNSRLLEEPSVV